MAAGGGGWTGSGFAACSLGGSFCGSGGRSSWGGVDASAGRSAGLSVGFSAGASVPGLALGSVVVPTGGRPSRCVGGLACGGGGCTAAVGIVVVGGATGGGAGIGAGSGLASGAAGGVSIVTSMASSKGSVGLSGEIHKNAAATTICSVVVSRIADGGMRSKWWARVKLTSWATAMLVLGADRPGRQRRCSGAAG
ncbi:MAG: hypothetical protein J0H77_04175 [Alphaproteobacteria bacterium]|nr:hypothetical protein [Alphaproteobacteria bacterium]